MESSHLREVVDAVFADYKRGKLLSLLETVVTTYTATIQSPSAQIAEAFEVALVALRESLHGSQCSLLPPSRTRILRHIGGDTFCGEGLLQGVQEAVSASSSPASAVEALQELRSGAAAFFETTSSLREAMTKLRINPDVPAGDRARVEVAIPLDLFDGNLGLLSKEAGQLNRALLDITEVVTGERHAVEINGAGTGSIELYLSVDLGSGASLIAFITTIVNLVTATIGLRKSRAELEAKGAPTEALKSLQEWEDKRIEGELKRLVDEAIKKSPLERGRKSEMRKGLTESLKYLADRIDRGMDVDVSVDGETEIADHSGEEGETVAILDQNARARATIRENSGVIKQLLRDREPILRISQGSVDGE